MKTSKQDQIAITILKQIGSLVLSSIGASHKVSLPAEPGLVGGVMFNVSLFGDYPLKVAVALTYGDLYRVTIAKPDGTMLNSFDRLDFEEMPEAIESTVEAYYKANEQLQTMAVSH